ncbi:MAG TPA: hypothetical protein VFF11_13300, partial [Candidatus Binatia bacterium]|nr:hypothetical protein [Candidatus Binatia bacterium]
SLKLQQGERVPAKADLITALKLDPAYTFASLNLFDLQLEDSEIDAAKRTLDLIKRHAGSEQGKACEIKLRTRFLQISAASKKKCTKTSGKTEPAEWDQAFQQFKELCSRRETAPEHINQAIQALLQAKQGKRLDQLLSELILMPESNPNVGAWWMERRFDQGRWYCPRKIHRLCPESPAARNAVIKLIECLGEQNREIGRTHLLAYVIITLAKLSGTWSRRLILLWLSRRHRHWLRQDDEAWATMGLSLFRLQRHRSAIRWMRDWREREGVKMWMLFNLVLALRTCRRWDESLEVLERAVKLPQQDHSFAPLRLFLALELALRGDAEKAVVHFRELKNNGWSNYMQIQYRYAQGLLAVQQAPAELRWKTFRSERRAIKSLLAKYRVSLYRADYRRCLTRLARDAGQPFYVFLTWIGG